MPVGQTNRRVFFAALGGAAAWPLAARAQQAGRMRRIALLLPASASDPEFQARVGAFLQGLRQAGWVCASGISVDRKQSRQCAQACCGIDRI